MKRLAIPLTVVFYFLIVVLGIMLLAAVQLRSPGGATFDTWRLNYEANRVLNAKLVDELQEASKKARGDSNTVSVYKACLRLFDESGVPKMNLLDAETIKDIEEAKEKRTPIEKLSGTGDVYCVIRGYAWLQSDIAYFEETVKDDESKIADLKTTLANNAGQYADLIKGQQDFLAFMEMEKVRYRRPFIAAPYDLLILLLVMFMGALGGMVRLLRDFGAPRRPNPSTAEYFLIPLIGAVVAIGGYVLAKTGLLLLSSSRGESSLSPFMISLVGIVSGLLAKEVIDTIAFRGRKIFGQT